jgi:hypothetical protein
LFFLNGGLALQGEGLVLADLAAIFSADDFCGVDAALRLLAEGFAIDSEVY